ncbi:MAG: glycosyltransferase [Terriglobales bacterium]
MHTAAIAVGVASVGAWVYLLLGRGWFWRAGKCSAKNICGKIQTGIPVSVVAVLPARNERETIGRAIKSLFGQEFAGRLHVVVVDDHSEDGTAEAARESGEDDRLIVIKAKALPAGWTGKVWAMQQGIEAARDLRPEFILLTDADVVHGRNSLATLVSVAKEGRYDLTSFMVRLHCESMAERLLIPAFVFFFFMLYPPRWIAAANKKTAGAAGGCMFVRADALERAGGLDAIRGEVIDDCALARAIKAERFPSAAEADLTKPRRRAAEALPLQSGRVWLGLGDSSESLREYGSFAEIGRMIARTAFNQLRHSWLMLAGALAGMAITFVVPVALIFLYPTQANPAWVGHSGFAWGTLGLMLGALAWALMTLAYLPVVLYYRLNGLWAVTLPLAASFYMGATVWSAVKYWSGRGGEWKGRAQDGKTRRCRI